MLSLCLSIAFTENIDATSMITTASTRTSTFTASSTIIFLLISAITNNYTEISNKIYSYLDSSSYKELSDYSDEIDALDNKAFDKEYSVLMGVRYYVWSVGFMNTNDSDNYNLTQSDVSNLAYYLSQFYYYTQLSAYKDKEVTMTSDNEKYLNKMREDMGVLLKKYYHITDEDLEAIDTFSSARIEQCLIQRG